MSALPRGKQSVRTCDSCGIPESDAVRLEPYWHSLICTTDRLELELREAAVTEMAAHLRPLLQHRYKYMPEQFLKDLDDLASREPSELLEMVGGTSWKGSADAPEAAS